jgi:carbon-monoxide dehydrogenase medium subunit
MKAFDYMRPSSLEEACRLLGQFNGQAKVLAGGTDLLVQFKQRKMESKALISLRDIPELSFIRLKPDQGISIGAMTTLSAVETSKEISQKYPAIVEAASWIGSVQVRNRATLGGNLCNAAPSADMAPILIAYSATTGLTNGQKERTVLLEDFFTGPGQTVLERGELMKEINLPPPPRSSFGTYVKAYRSKMDIALVGVGILAVFEKGKEVCQDLKLVLGAVAPTPIRAKESEKRLVGCKLGDELIIKVSQMASEEAHPISDVRSTAEYRRTLVKVLIQRALLAARSWAQKGGNR